MTDEPENEKSIDALKGQKIKGEKVKGGVTTNTGTDTDFVINGNNEHEKH